MKYSKTNYCVVCYDFKSGDVLDFSGALPLSVCQDVMKSYLDTYPGCRLSLMICAATEIEL